MIVTGWNHGDHQKSGAGYGVKLNADDRDQFFKRDWETILPRTDRNPVLLHKGWMHPTHCANAKRFLSIFLSMPREIV